MNEYLGQGIKYPLQLENGRVVTVSEEDNIKQSLYNLFSTPKGTQLLNREYGFRGHELTFEPNDEVLKSLLELFVREAIVTHEPRVRLRNVSFSVSEDVCTIGVHYEIRSSRELGFFEFPFNRDRL